MLQPVETVEILTLQDNYINITAADNDAIVTRARKLLGGARGPSITAEHGFSAVVSTTAGGRKRSLLFDFGTSPRGAADNARTLGIGPGLIEIMALSHGHYDHFEGFEALTALLGMPGIPLVVHPAAFRNPRYFKGASGKRHAMPSFTRDRVKKAGVEIQETVKPKEILGDTVLFLGEIERTTDFEKGMPGAFYEEEGEERRDLLEDDTSLVMNLRGRGLVVLSGCAHAGIVNSVRYARKVTGIDKIHVVMGGFHLTGPLDDPVLHATVAALKDLGPDHVAPCHCCSREAVMLVEREMPDRFLFNMSGTRVVFSAADAQAG